MSEDALAVLPDGRRAVWDDTAEEYRVHAPDGSVLLARPFDAFELGQKAERAARAIVVANDARERDRLRVGIPKVRAAIADADTNAANSSGNTRVLWTHLATSLRANLALAKLMAGVLDVED